ncbi:ABC transporter permease [Acetobacterium wieringae]|uniref:Nickel import system permease protein NikB n=1 Tax=Acetobacterium wieringae TaxID=52694 RepID=A0ABY6HEC0_9FIRM|nr:nickel ABC transporter permease [Acetobacterium wieringae]UYO62888.1 ABC transporter permease [Acetobacterium wieringae]VUZ26693.1 Nickel transport system permease protein NikB [Acetobacterium wieringae]
MGNYITKRLFQLIPILLGVSFITFALMYIAPSDPAEMKLSAQGTAVSQEVIDETREEMGLNKPFIEQYLIWLLNLLKGDMGVSYVDNLPVSKKIVNALPSTIILAFSSMILTLVISIPLGVLSAVKQNRLIDYLIRFFTFIGTSVPNFFLALVLIYVFAMQLGLLPVLASGSIKGLILPTIALATVMISKYIRQVRAAVLEELKKDYVMGARSRGIQEGVILFKNVLRNSMITIVTLVGLSIGSLLGGAAVVETIFVWRGLGKMVVDAIGARDYPVIQGFVVWMAIIYVLVNLLTDLSYHLLDPRVKEGWEG